MPKRKRVERYATWAALKPQLKGIRLGAAKPQLACVHIGDGHVTVDAAALRDWTQVVEGAKFWFDTSETAPGRTHLAARTVDGQKFSARFYAQKLVADNVWEVYL